MSVFSVATPVHSFIGFDLANKIFQAAFVPELALKRCPSNLSRVLNAVDDMHPEYSKDMTLTVKYNVHDEALSPSDEEIRQAFATYIVVFAAYILDAAHILDLDWHVNTNETTYEDLMSGKFFDEDISFFYGVVGDGGLKTVCISDVVLLASAIAGLDLSRWPPSKVKDVVGESLNPVEYEVLTTAIAGIVAANEELEKKGKQLEAEHQAKLKALLAMSDNAKESIYSAVASALEKNLAHANAKAMVDMFVFS